MQTVSAIHSFVLAMVLYPNVQKRAQAEIDRVVGPDRLPTFEDRDQLPYIEAVVKEVLRWQPVAPLGRDQAQLIFKILLILVYISRPTSSCDTRRHSCRILYT
jgi:cytochrome P450